MRLPRRPKEQDLEDEIQAHLAIETRQRIERGEAPEDAALAARREFGSVALVKEVTRSMGGFGLMDSLLQDLKYAGRTMRKTPGFTAIAIVTLALGIGATTAIFSVVDTAMFRPLPFQDSDRLVRVWMTRAGMILGGWSPMDIRDFAAAAHSFDGMVSYDHPRKNVSLSQGSSQPEELVVGLVPGAYFDVLRIRPILGRVFTPEENQYGTHFVAAISEGLWRTRFASDPGVIGRTLRINGESYQIVGVMPQVVPTWMDNTAVPIGVWTPFTSLSMWTEAARGGTGDSSIGRLSPGVSIEQARSEIAGIAARLSTEHPVLQGLGATIEPLADTTLRWAVPTGPRGSPSCCNQALARMLDGLMTPEGRQFYVGVVGYFFDDAPYLAQGFTVSQTETPDLQITTEGFTCDAFAAGDTLEPARATPDLVRVRVNVRRCDIWAIAEIIDRKAQWLFYDLEVWNLRRPPFIEDMIMWGLSRERSGDEP